MIEVYDRELNVSPFLVSPIALINKEFAFVLGPARLSRDSHDFIDKLYRHITEKGWSNPIICQVMPFGSEILVANTIQTNTPDSDSGRIGLKLTYGALIRKETFLYYPNVCQRVFALLDKYFIEEFGFPMSFDGASRIVGNFQRRDESVENLVSAEKTNDLLTHLEHAFFLNGHGRGIFRRMKLLWNYRNIPSRRRAPMPKIEHSWTFWRNIDERVGRTNKTVERMLREFEEVANLRGLGSNELVRAYVEAGLREDLDRVFERRYTEIIERMLGEQKSLSDAERSAFIAKFKVALAIESSSR